MNGENHYNGGSKMRSKDYHIYLTDMEYHHIIQSLINMKNELIEQGRYTDAVDDVPCKFASAKKKKVRVQYI